MGSHIDYCINDKIYYIRFLCLHKKLFKNVAKFCAYVHKPHAYVHHYSLCSDEETDIKALVTSWLKSLSQTDTISHLEGLMEDYFYKSLEWVISTNDFVVDTTLVGVALNGLSHLTHITNKSQFACALVKGLGGNLGEQSRLNFSKR